MGGGGGIPYAGKVYSAIAHLGELYPAWGAQISLVGDWTPAEETLPHLRGTVPHPREP